MKHVGFDLHGISYRAAVALCALGIALLATGCGDDDGTNSIDAAPGIDAPEQPADAGQSDAGEGKVCGGFIGDNCAETEYCDYPDNQCGSNDRTGRCQPRPMACAPVVAPVCGCSGDVAPSECDAFVEGKDISVIGNCTPPEDYFACGSSFCRIDNEYCLKTISDVEGVADSYECKGMPTACRQSPSCDCLMGEECGNMCAEQQGNYVLTCPGG